jgi:hypothetical protein
MILAFFDTATDTVGSLMPVGSFVSFLNERTEKRVIISFAEDDNYDICHKPDFSLSSCWLMQS